MSRSLNYGQCSSQHFDAGDAYHYTHADASGYAIFCLAPEIPLSSGAGPRPRPRHRVEATATTYLIVRHGCIIRHGLTTQPECSPRCRLCEGNRAEWYDRSSRRNGSLSRPRSRLIVHEQEDQNACPSHCPKCPWQATRSRSQGVLVLVQTTFNHRRCARSITCPAVVLRFAAL